MLKLEEAQLQTLLSQPETGMGYQIVEFRDKRYNSVLRKGLVVNAEILFESSDFRVFRKYSLLEARDFLEKGSKKSVDIIEGKMVVIPDRDVSLEINLFKSSVKPFALAAKNAEITDTIRFEVFKRFSAFENDRRITQNRGLLPGTYTTTELDSRNVKTGMEAVNRYALPNDDPAVFVFTIRPLEKTEVKRGIVEPVGIKQGGGVEVLFINGTSSNTVAGPSQIPAK